MEHFYISKSKSCVAFSISLLFHLFVISIFLWQSLSQRHHPSFMQQTDDPDCFVAQKIISAGHLQPATVLFQDEAPSGDDIVSSASHEHAQAAQETEQSAQGKTKAPLDEPEQSTTTGFDTFATPIPTQQIPEMPVPIAFPQQKVTPPAQRRTTNKKSVTMADVSRGFIKSMQQEAGYNDASRDMKQLTLQVYATKIWNLIKNAFLTGDNGLHLTQDVSAHTLLVLTIDRTGKLLNIHLDYPKHITSLRNIERLIISRAHQAGLFPPLPAQISGTSKTFSFPLFIEGQKGFHAYSLGYQ